MTDNGIFRGTLTVDEFLRSYWQKKPLLIRKAIPDIHSPITPDELAGLSLEEEVESRLVTEDTTNGSWKVEYGPFTVDTFSTLPESHWTLLVQKLDQWIPELGELLEKFSFLPRWRIDDIMVSYAVSGGNVGPHLDSYDVFLLQLQGKRRWRINEHDYNEEHFIPGQDLRIIRDFQYSREWILDTGDMLYLPPGVAHHGVALEPCLTCSVGFRAPSRHELLAAYAEDLLEDRDHDQRYTDPERTQQAYSGEISTKDIHRLHKLVTEAIADRDQFADWFGSWITRVDEKPYARTSTVSPANPMSHKLQRDLQSRLCFTRHDDGIHLHCNGELLLVNTELLPLVDLLCRQHSIDRRQLEPWLDNEAARDLINTLVQRNILTGDD